MKRLLFYAGMAFWMFGVVACNENTGPDTSGVTPGGIDTTQAGTNMNSGSPNMNNDGTNNNQTVNTADSNINYPQDTTRQ